MTSGAGSDDLVSSTPGATLGTVQQLARGFGRGRVHVPLRLLFLGGGHGWIRIAIVVLVVILLALIARNRR
jgi:hypothetical protein